MRLRVKYVVSILLVLSSCQLQLTAFSSTLTHANASTGYERQLIGRWHVKFTFMGREEKNLTFESHREGTGTFRLLDTAEDLRPEKFTRPAAWALTTNDRVSISAEVELPIGTCCREVGTLILKGKFDSDNSLAGKVVFVASTTDEENPIGFRSLIGTFTASRD